MSNTHEAADILEHANALHEKALDGQRHILEICESMDTVNDEELETMRKNIADGEKIIKRNKETVAYIRKTASE